MTEEYENYDAMAEEARRLIDRWNERENSEDVRRDDALRALEDGAQDAAGGPGSCLGTDQIV